MKILIISHYFPPQNSIASLRPYSWAKHWSQAGHNVTVLTTPTKSMPSDSPLPFDGFDVIEAPIPGMARFSKFLNSSKPDTKKSTQGHTSNVDGRFSFNLKGKIKKSIEYLQAHYGVAASCRMPDPLDFWCGSALKALGGQSWDLVISTAWPYAVHAPAYELKRQGLAKYWIADWRDLWVDNHMYPGLPGFRRIERFLERRWCISADAITTVSSPLAETLRTKYGNKVHVIFNGFDPDDYIKLPSELAFPKDGVFRIVYTGTIYQGQRDPTPLFKALANVASSHNITPEQIQIIFCGSNSNVNDLAKRENVANFVRYEGFLPRSKALHMQRDASALLLLEYESESVKGILTGKLFEYLFAGPHIWAVGVGSDSAIGNILNKSDRGLAVEKDIHLIERLILNSLSMKYTNRNNINSEIIHEFSRKKQAQKIIEICS